MTTTGSKYESGRDVAEVARLFRADVQAAQKRGELPTGLKVSVRISRYSGGATVDVTVKAAPVRIYNLEYIHFRSTQSRCLWMGEAYTDAARALLRKLEGMLAEYQQQTQDDRSDYGDRNFSIRVHISSALEREDAAITTEYLKALGPTPYLRLVG